MKIGYQGAGDKTVVPYPGFPALNEYTKGIADLLQKYPVDDFNLDKSATMIAQSLEMWLRTRRHGIAAFAAATSE